MYGFIPVDKPPGLWGGYAEHQYLAPDSLLLPGAGVARPGRRHAVQPARRGHPVGRHRARHRRGRRRRRARPGHPRPVRGRGRAGGRRRVRDGHRARRRATASGSSSGRPFGADLTVDSADDDPVAALRHATGGLADVVVDVTAKAPAALAQALALARPGGTVVVAGTRGSADTPGFWPDLIVYKELRILGALGVDAAAYRAALDLLATGRYPFADLPRRVAGLDGVEAVLADDGGRARRPAPVHGVVAP